MVDLALKMLLDDKARFAATVLGVGFAVALVLIQVGLFFGLLENASITIERLDADLWVTAREHAQRRLRQPVPRDLRPARPVGPGRGPRRQPDRLVRHRVAADRGEGVGRLLRPGGLRPLELPLERRVGADRRPPARPVRDARRLGRAAVRPVRGRRLPRVPGPPAQDHRPDPRAPARSRPARSRSSTTGSRSRSRPRSSTGRTTFIIVKLEPGADRRGRPARDPAPAAVQRRPHARASGRAMSRRYWIESTGLGLTIFLTVSLGALVGVVIVAQTLYASTTEHLRRVRHRQGARRARPRRLRDDRRAGDVRRRRWASASAWRLTFGLGPALARLDMKMIDHADDRPRRLRGDAGALPGGRDRCRSARSRSLDPAIVFRG